MRKRLIETLLGAIFKFISWFTLSTDNWTFPPHYLKCYDQTFLCYAHASYNILLAWVALCGHAEETKDYVSAVTIFDPDKKVRYAQENPYQNHLRKQLCIYLFIDYLIFSSFKPNGLVGFTQSDPHRKKFTILETALPSSPSHFSSSRKLVWRRMDGGSRSGSVTLK